MGMGYLDIGCCMCGTGGNTFTCQGCTVVADTLTVSYRYLTSDGSGTPYPGPSTCTGNVAVGPPVTLNYSTSPMVGGSGWISDYFLAPTDSFFNDIYSTSCRYFRFVYACIFDRMTLQLQIASDGSGSNCSSVNYNLQIFPATGGTCSPFYQPYTGWFISPSTGLTTYCNNFVVDAAVTP